MRFRLSAHAAMIRAWAVIVLVSALYILLGCLVAYLYGVAWWWGLVPIGIMLVFGEAVLLSTRDHPLGGRECVELTRETDPRLHEVLDRLCALNDSARPELRLMDLSSANALTHTDRDGKSVIYLSAELVTVLDTPKLEAVLAHEMAHITNRDQRLLLFATGMTQWPLLLAKSVTPLMAWFDSKVLSVAQRCGQDWEPLEASSAPEPSPSSQGPRAPVLRSLTTPFLWILAVVRVAVLLVLVLANLPLLLIGGLVALPGMPAVLLLNRQRELAADRAAAELTGTPSTLAAALDRLQEHRARIPTRDLRASNVSALAIVPVTGRPNGWLSTHPSLTRRMNSLREQVRS